MAPAAQNREGAAAGERPFDPNSSLRSQSEASRGLALLLRSFLFENFEKAGEQNSTLLSQRFT